jgi:hypothetical protein
VKVGAENRTKVIAAAALGVVALAVIVTQFAGWFSGSSSSAAAPVGMTGATDFGKAVVPSARRPTRVRNRDSQSKQQSQARNLDPSLRLDLLKSSEDTKYEGTGRNIFKVFVEIPKPIVAPVKAPEVQAQGPPPPPPPPPSNLIFYGFATPQGGVKRIFLTKNEDVFIAKEGDIVDRRYKVVKISPNSVEILDVLSNNRENLPLRQG